MTSPGESTLVVERERDSRDWSRHPPDRERERHCPSRELPACDSQEQDQPPEEPPTSLEHDRKSCSNEVEDSTEGGAQVTAERERALLLQPPGGKKQLSHTHPPEAMTLVPPLLSHRPVRGGRGDIARANTGNTLRLP